MLTLTTEGLLEEVIFGVAFTIAVFVEVIRRRRRQGRRTSEAD